MDDMKISRLSDDVHLIAAPFRWVSGVIKTVIFLAVLPLVLIGLAIHGGIQGGPIMDDDMWFLVKVLFCVLTPFAAALTVGFLGWLVSETKDFPHGRTFLSFVLSIVMVGAALKTRAITFNLNDHAPAIWSDPNADYSGIDKGGSIVYYIKDKDGELTEHEIRKRYGQCGEDFSDMKDSDKAAKAVETCHWVYACMANSGYDAGWKAQHCRK